MRRGRGLAWWCAGLGLTFGLGLGLSGCGPTVKDFHPRHLSGLEPNGGPPVLRAGERAEPSHRVVTALRGEEPGRYLVWVIEPGGGVYVERQAPLPVEWFGPLRVKDFR